MIDNPRVATALVCCAFVILGVAGIGALAPEAATAAIGQPLASRAALEAPRTLTPSEVPWSTISARLQQAH